MAAHLARQGAFGVRMGPPVVTRRWSAAQVKEGIADEAVHRLTDVPPLERSRTGAAVVAQLTELGWRPQAVEGGFAAGQPQYNFVIPLTHADGTPRTEDEVLAGMNQLWRRNIKKAAKQGVVVERGDRADLKAFHDLYVHTAERDHFTPRGLRYFETMYDALSAEADGRIAVWCARHEGDLVASTIAIRVGTHAWYSYGASSTEKREVRGSNAVQWAMIARRAGRRRGGLRPARHHRHPRRRRLPRRAHPVQGRHRRRGRRVRRRVGPAAQPSALQGVRPLHEAARFSMSLRLTVDGAALARAPARHGRRPARDRAGRQGQRLRLHHRPARPPRAVAARARRDTGTPVDMIAVGTYDELAQAATRYAGDLLVLTPWRPFGGAVEVPEARAAPRSCTPSAASRTCAPSPTRDPTPASCSSS